MLIRLGNKYLVTGLRLVVYGLLDREILLFDIFTNFSKFPPKLKPNTIFNT